MLENKCVTDQSTRSFFRFHDSPLFFSKILIYVGQRVQRVYTKIRFPLFSCPAPRSPGRRNFLIFISFHAVGNWFKAGFIHRAFRLECHWEPSSTTMIGVMAVHSISNLDSQMSDVTFFAMSQHLGSLSLSTTSNRELISIVSTALFQQNRFLPDRLKVA